MTVSHDSPIADLGLTTAAPSALAAAGITTVGQLLALTRAELNALKGMGTARVNDVETALTRHGLVFDGERAPTKCPTCGNLRVGPRGIVVSLDGTYNHAGLRDTPACHDCDAYHREVWARAQAHKAAA